MSKKHYRDESVVLARRQLIKWGLFTGAALGIPQWKVFEVLEGTGGKALAQAAACGKTNRVVYLYAGNGGLAWFTQMWTPNAVAAAAAGGNMRVAALTPGEGVTTQLATGTDFPLTVGNYTPFKALPGGRNITAFIAGSNNTHTRVPASVSIANNVDALASAAAQQVADSPSPVPIINMTGGNNASRAIANPNTPGAPAVTMVADPLGIVSLFNSTASKTLLQDPAAADLYASSVPALYQALTRASTLKNPSLTKSRGVMTGAATGLGRNMEALLKPAADDNNRYLTANAPGNNVKIAQTLIVTRNLFKNGLSGMVTANIFEDDPHGAFNNVPNVRMVSENLGKSLDTFMNDLMQIDDPLCAGSKVGDNTIIVISGDTNKDPLNRNGWPDNTAQGSKFTYILSSKRYPLKTGWLGEYAMTGNPQIIDPATGMVAAGRTSNQNNAAAAAAIVYATAGIQAANSAFTGVTINGILNDPALRSA